METQGKKPQSIQALDAELETIEVSTANTELEDTGENENQTDLSWQVEDVDPEGDPENSEATGRQPESHPAVSDAEIEVLKNRAKLAGNAVRHQVQEARAHSVLGRLWQVAALESKPDIDGKFHPARWKIGLWLGVPACLGFALVLATVLAPTATAKQPCLPGEVIAADGSSPCEPLVAANTMNTVGTTGANAQSAQTPETAIVDAPALPKSTMNGDPLPNPEPTLAPTEPLRAQNEEIPPPATAGAPNATALESDATMSSGGFTQPTYPAPSGEAPYLAPAQAIEPAAASAARNRAQPARGKTYVLSNGRQPRAATVTFKPSMRAAPLRSRVLSSAGEYAGQTTDASSTTVSTNAPRAPLTVTTQGAERAEGGAASQVQMQRSVLLSAPALSEPVGVRGQAVAGDARAPETQARSASVALETRAPQTQTRNANVGTSSAPTNPARTVTLGSSQNSPGSNAPSIEVAQAGLGQDTYPIGSQVQAKLRFGFLAVEGHDDIPVVAESADGSVWLGWASINKESRVEILFREVYIKGKSYLTGAQAYNLEKLPGLNGTARYEAPNLVADLLQAAVGGISTYVNDLTQRGTTTTSGASVTTSRNTGPTLGQTVLGRAANLFDIGKDTRALIRLVEVSADTPFLVIVLPKR